MISRKTGAEIILKTQYLKDLSFENPKAPQIYTYQELKPALEVNLNLNATKLQNDTFESEIALSIIAKNNNETILVLEIIYAGIFMITKVDENLIQENLFIDCPTILFPFIKRITFDISRDANIPPISLDLVDFEELYNSKKETLKKNDK